MLVVGLTGGIGAGKSTVAAMLADAGWTVIDADAAARRVVEVGRPALAEIAARFGTEVIAGDGTLDRAGLAAVVFNDDVARHDLEAITHPRIGEEIAAQFAAVEAAERDDGIQRIVVLDHPLLVEKGMATAMAAVVVVEAPAEVRVERLVQRGLSEEDARARIRVQASDEQRRAVATHVVDNAGDLADLQRQVDVVVDDLRRRLATP